MFIIFTTEQHYISKTKLVKIANYYGLSWGIVLYLLYMFIQNEVGTEFF